MPPALSGLIAARRRLRATYSANLMDRWQVAKPREVIRQQRSAHYGSVVTG
jgi:hypothetical protein